MNKRYKVNDRLFDDSLAAINYVNYLKANATEDITITISTMHEADKRKGGNNEL